VDGLSIFIRFRVFQLHRFTTNRTNREPNFSAQPNSLNRHGFSPFAPRLEEGQSSEDRWIEAMLIAARHLVCPLRYVDKCP
jgi:hypothetical protein